MHRRGREMHHGGKTLPSRLGRTVSLPIPPSTRVHLSSSH